VVHHSLVAWGVWVGLKFGAGGHNAFFPFINCGVHTIMYTYYCLAALGPNVRKYLWWKRYLTIIQMVQFVVALIHACIPLFIDCGYHPGFAYALIAHAVLFWVMFYNFYRKNYNERQSRNYSLLNNDNEESTCHRNGALLKSISNGHSVLRNGDVKGIAKKIN
jgi:phosphatidylglycerophosphate synthase